MYIKGKRKKRHSALGKLYYNKFRTKFWKKPGKYYYFNLLNDLQLMVRTGLGLTVLQKLNVNFYIFFSNQI